MKKQVLFSFLLIISQSIIAQNWAPINTTEKFCYETDTAGLISHVLWVDSISPSTNPELLYLNKIAVLWETAGENTYINFQSEFLLDEIEIYSTGEWYFSDTLYPSLTFDNFSLFPYSTLNESWNFTDDISATITELSIMDIFGEEDSVKTISLSSGQEIVLSKNYGIINWMNEYQLIGIEGRDLGVTVPTFDDMFTHISPGDVVCYAEGQWWADEQVYGWNRQSRYDIMDITHYTDSVVIGAYVRSNYEEYWKNTNDKLFFGYQDMVFYPTSITEAYPNEATYVEGIIDGFVINRLGTHKWGGQKKSQVSYEVGGWFSTLYTECDELYFYELCPVGDEWLYEYTTFEYTPEYGFLEYMNSGFEWGGHKDLVGVIDNGDTLGYIYPIDMFVGQEEIDLASKVFVYPSPAKELLHIKTTEIEQINWSIFDISGKMVQKSAKVVASEKITIQVAHLPKGVYILQMELDGEIIREKFLKQ